MTSAEIPSLESGHTTPDVAVGWVAKHILAHIEELPAFCEKYGLDDERRASLRRVYETALEDYRKIASRPIVDNGGW